MGIGLGPPGLSFEQKVFNVNELDLFSDYIQVSGKLSD